MNLSQKVAFNTVVQIVSKSVTVFFGLLTTILLTGYLGSENYGNYMYITALVTIFGALADWGTATIGVREASQRKKEQEKILANIFLVRLGLTFFSVLLMVLTAIFLPLKVANPALVRQGMSLGVLILVLLVTRASLAIVFQTRLEMEKTVLTNIVAGGLIFFLSWILISLQMGLLFLLGALVLAYLVGLIVAWILVQKTIKFDFCWDSVFVRHLLRESLPMGAILLMFTVDNKIDTVMLGIMKGSRAVGIYAVAYRIYDVLILGAAFLMNALLPVLSQYSSSLGRTAWGWGCHPKLKRGYQRAFDVLLIMGLGVVVFIWFFAPLMVRILTQQRSAEFDDSVLVLRILSFALFLAYFNHLTGYTIVALGKQRPYFLVALTALVFNLTANSFLIPRFSYFGAAAVTVLTEGLVLLITTLFVFRLIGIFPSLFRFPQTAFQLFKKKGGIFE